MKVTIVDGSQKAALRKTRQILCLYLDRVGSETYIGNISQDGLSALRKSLLDSGAITKLASISCFLHRNGRLPELIWVLGSKKNISTDGSFAYKTRSLRRKDRQLVSPLMEYIKVAVWLAGLFHDLGKGTNGFQNKLLSAVTSRGNYTASQDPVRHEFISAMLLGVEDPESFMKSLSEFRGVKGVFDERSQWLKSDGVKKQTLDLLQKTLSISTVDKNEISDLDVEYFYNGIDLNSQEKWKKNPLWMSVLWLVFTHHKLPSGEWYGRKGAFTSILSRHVGIKYDSKEISNFGKVDEFLRMEVKDQPWDHNEWIRSVNRAVKKLYELRASYPGYEFSMFESFNVQTPWMTSLTRVGRTCLVMADYEASCDSVKEIYKQNPKGKVFANTKFDSAGISQFADPLHVHLKKVGEIAPQIVQRLFINQDSTFIKPSVIESYDVPSQLQIPSFIEPGRFEWQGHVQREVSKYKKDKKGFFCVVAAGTGRGKTKACAAIMTNSRDDCRFSVGLSMRSLTFQTAKSYLSEIVGFRHDQVSMLVGDDVLKRRFRNEKNRNVSRLLNSAGTENVLLDDSEEQYSIISSAPESVVMSLKSLRGDHFLMRLLSSPVSVMTIDHIVRLVDLAKSKDVLQFLHIMATDLVLDEVDDYKGDDLIVIGRLIELFGQFGRRVVVASATLPKTVVDGFRSAYLKGYSTYQHVYGGSDPDTLIVTHLPPYITTIDGSDFNEVYSEVMRNFSAEEEALAKSENRRVVRTVKQSNSFYSIDHNRHSSRDIDAAHDEYFGLSTTSVIGLHKANAMIDPETGIGYSIGFARFNSVVNTQKFSKWHEKFYPKSMLGRRMAKEGLSIKLMCYHAQTLGAMRVVQEQFFERHLNRTAMNSGASDPFLESPDVRRTLAEAKKSHKKDVVFVVSTSSIMETGRDFDFDWALLEPCSTASIVQASGRVRRHRFGSLIGGWNISLMPMSLNATIRGRSPWRDIRDKRLELKAVPKDKILSMLSGVGIKFTVPVTKNPDVVMGALPNTLAMGILHAGHALMEPDEYADAPLTSTERIAQLATFCKYHAFEGESHLTLEYATTHCDPLLTSRFYQETKFRGGNGSDSIQLDRDTGLWITSDKLGNVKDVSYLIYEKYDQESESVYFLCGINIVSRDHLLDFSLRLGRGLGYHKVDSGLADSNLLAFSKNLDLDKRFLFEPQLGFSAE